MSRRDTARNRRQAPLWALALVIEAAGLLALLYRLGY